MYKKFYHVILLVLIMTFMPACSKQSVEGSGVNVSQLRTLAPFTKIFCRGSFNLRIINGDSQKITIHADENLQHYIDTKVDKHTLYVKPIPMTRLVSHKPIIISIQMNQLQSLRIAGQNHVDVNQLANNKLRVRSSGNNKIRLSGRTKTLIVHCAGTCQLNSLALMAQQVSLNLMGKNQAKVYAKQHLHIDVSGFSMVEYLGHPELTQRITGKANIQRLQTYHSTTDVSARIRPNSMASQNTSIMDTTFNFSKIRPL